MTDSILDTIKKMLGVDSSYDAFDIDIITHINSVFMNLFQIGVGPITPFSIKDNKAKWSDFIGEDNSKYEAIKSYIYFKVRLAFDPPTSSFVLDSIKQQIAELEWRLNMQSEEFK